jgi:MoaA/NifB/PqqE/SkfB family radical SAM enzyme
MIDREYNRFYPSDPDLNNFYLGKNSIDYNFNNIIAKEIRTDLAKGKRHPACRLCWEEEAAGRTSKRIRDNDKYLHLIKETGNTYEGLAKLELNLGNTCNIKCRTCHPNISSMWMKEAYDLDHAQSITFKAYADGMKKYHQQYDEDSLFWDDLEKNLSTIKQFDFYGGEPFLSKKMWDILSICIEKGYAKDIELHYNTNGTLWPEQVTLWQEFKSVNLSFSIDGYGEKFEYMRYPATWDIVKENMNKAIEFKKVYGNINISWCITLSTLNIFYLPETLNEYYNNYSEFGLYLNLVHGPKHFNISYLHPKVKEDVIKKLQSIPNEYVSAKYQLPGILGFIENGTFNQKVWDMFVSAVVKHDSYRKQDFTATFSEYANLMKDAGII